MEKDMMNPESTEKSLLCVESDNPTWRNSLRALVTEKYDASSIVFENTVPDNLLDFMQSRGITRAILHELRLSDRDSIIAALNGGMHIVIVLSQILKPGIKELADELKDNGAIITKKELTASFADSMNYFKRALESLEFTSRTRT